MNHYRVISSPVLLLMAMVLLLVPLLTGCSEEPGKGAPQKLVVEGWIDSDGYPVVLLSLTAVPKEQVLDVAENIVRWGVVTISDGERSVILTGGPSTDYFPPFRYYTYDMVGQPCKTYTLTAEYQEHKVSSTVTMPPAPVSATLSRTTVEDCDTLDHLQIHFTPPSDDLPAYYHLSYRINGRDSRFLPCMLGTLEVPASSHHSLSEVVMPVYRSRSSLISDDFQPEMPRGASITVRLERISFSAYQFWHAFDDATLTEGSIFVSSANSIPSNITGGLGLWSPQGTLLLTSP